MSDAHPSPPDDLINDPDEIARLRQGIAALQGGDRAGAYPIFSELVQSAPQDVNAWLGLALSSDKAGEAFGALRQARLVQPDNPFIANAANEVGARWPDYEEMPPGLEIEALPVGRTGEAEERDPLTAAIPLPPDTLSTHEQAAVAAEPAEAATAGGARLTEGPRPPDAGPARRGSNVGRVLAALGLGLLFLLLIAALGSGVLTTGLFRPPPPPPTLTPLPTLPAPVVKPPPTVPAPPTSPPATPAPPASPTVGSGDAARQAAMQAVADGRYSQAIPLLEQLTARNPGDVEAQYALGLAYLSAGDRPNGAVEALLAFRSVAAVQPDWAPGQRMVAEALMKQTPPQYTEALVPARRATDLDPARAEMWLTLAQAYEGAGDAANATLAYDQAAQHSPPPPPVPPTVPPTVTPTPIPTATPTETPAPVPSGAPEIGTPTPLAGETPSAGPTGTTGASNPATTPAASPAASPPVPATGSPATPGATTPGPAVSPTVPATAGLALSPGATTSPAPATVGPSPSAGAASPVPSAPTSPPATATP